MSDTAKNPLQTPTLVFAVAWLASAGFHFGDLSQAGLEISPAKVGGLITAICLGFSPIEVGLAYFYRARTAKAATPVNQDTAPRIIIYGAILLALIPFAVHAFGPPEFYLH